MMGKKISCVNKKEGILGCDPTPAGFNLVFLLHFWWILGDFQTFLDLCVQGHEWGTPRGLRWQPAALVGTGGGGETWRF